MKEEWLLRGVVVPVDVETTAALMAEIKRLIDVVGGMALVQPAQRKPLTDDEILEVCDRTGWIIASGVAVDIARAIEAAHGIK